MKIFVKFAEVKITMSIMSVVQKHVRAWEVPILQFKWPGAVQVLHLDWFELTEEQFEDQLSDLNMEYDRLRELYGSEPESKVPYIDTVYGGSMMIKQTFAPEIKNSLKRAATKPEREEAPVEPDVDLLGDNRLEPLDLSDIEDENAETGEVEDDGEITMPSSIATRQDAENAIIIMGGDPIETDTDEQVFEMLEGFLDDEIIQSNIDIDEDATVPDKFEALRLEKLAEAS